MVDIASTGLPSPVVNHVAPRPRNPYIAGNPVGGSPAFIGRADVLRAVYRVLRDPQHHGLVLYGQRRIGKTSILQQLCTSLPEQGSFRPVYFDLQDKARLALGQVLLDLARGIAEALRLPAPSPDGNIEMWFSDVWLPTVLATVSDGAAVVILCDEFDVIADVRAEQAASALFPYLRRLLAEAVGRLRFVFVIGRNVDDLANIAQSLFKTLPAEHVSLLSREDADALIGMSESNCTLQWEQKAKEAAWTLTSGHPFLLQHLCWQVWERLHDDEEANGIPTTTVDNVAGAVPRTLSTARNALEWLWAGLPPAGRVVASAFAGAGARPISQDELERLLHESGVRVVIRELRDAPKRLEEWDLIEPTEGGYRFRVELLRQWIGSSKPLSRVQKELDNVEPLAEKLYGAAELQYEAGEFDAAIGLVRQTLGINPNHVRASELLADILISRQEWIEARVVLERLHGNSPAVARARLVQVLMALTERTTDEDEHLTLLEQILTIQKHPIAEAAQRRIWKERGDRAWGAGRLEEAVYEYRRAGEVQLEKLAIDKLRRLELDAGLVGVAQLEGRGEYGAAYQEVCRLAEEFGDLREWSDELRRLEAAEELDAADRRAQQAAAAGDEVGAVQALLDVIGRDPRYRRATGRLHALIEGADMDALALAPEKLARAELTIALLEERVRLEEAGRIEATRLAATSRTNSEQLLGGLQKEVEQRNVVMSMLKEDLGSARAEVGALEGRVRLETAGRLEAVLAATAHQTALELYNAQVSKGKVELARAQATLTLLAERLRLLEAGRSEETRRLQAALAEAKHSAQTDDKLRRSRNRYLLVLGGLSMVLTLALVAAVVSQESSAKALRAEHESRKRLADEGPLYVDSIVLRSIASGNAAGKCISKDAAQEFPDIGTCHLGFTAMIRNNTVDIAAPTGMLCVRYLSPDGKLLEGDEKTLPPGTLGSCTLGIPLNPPGSANLAGEVVPKEKGMFALTSGFGNETGRFYADRIGLNRIELWWRGAKIGETKFTIVRTKAP